jgi:flagellar hook-associated protein 2
MSSISSIGFTAGGIDVASIVSGLMTAERAPETAVANRQAAVKLQSATISRLRSSLVSLQNQASFIVSSGITKLSSTISNPSAVSATLSPTARAGSLAFTVDSLAAAQGLRTANTVSASSAVITTASTLAISSTARRLGATAVQAGVGTTAGKYTVTVTQATAGATATGSAALAGSTVIDGTNNTLDLLIDGVAKTVTVAAGTYDATGLKTALQTALDAGGVDVTASVDGTGRLGLTTGHEGSTASLQVVSGSALTPLRLAAGTSTGTDGAVRIGTNAIATVTSAGTGGTVSVSTGTGSIDLTLGDGLRVGDAAVAVVSTGDRSLAAVTAAINQANVGASAAAVKVADGAWLMQLSSNQTGTVNALSLDSSAFVGAGGLLQTSAAKDATITVGAGAGAYSVSSSSNAFNDVMPGVTLAVTAFSSTPVNVSVGRDDSATADQVGALISSATSLLADIAMQTNYDTKTNTASPLSGDATVRRMAAQIRSAVTSLVTGASVSLAGNAGITLNKNGQIDFDRGKFMTALAADPDGVERLFGRGGTTVGSATFDAATDKTAAGSYTVAVTTAPTRATSGVVLAGGSLAGQTIGVRIGTTTATYQAAAGATPADIVSGLNHALASAGLKVNAETSGAGVALTAVGFGGGGSFDVNLDVGGGGSAWTTKTGADVVGTIDGKPAIGVGNRLSLLDTDTSPARGLAVDIAEGASGALGSVDYQPGIAARLVTLATNLTASNGALTTAGNGYDARIKAYNDQMDQFELRMTAKETQYRRQWTAVQANLSSLQNKQSWLASQINSLG